MSTPLGKAGLFLTYDQLEIVSSLMADFRKMFHEDYEEDVPGAQEIEEQALRLMRDMEEMSR